MPVSVAVIGVGHLGQHHARLLASMNGVELVGHLRHATVAARTRSPRSSADQVFADSRELLGRVDAVDGRRADRLRTSTSRCRFSTPALPRSWRSRSLRACEDADRLVDAARASRRAARNGTHRAIQSGGRGGAAAHLASRASSRSTASGTFPERSLDIDVIFDLMIHDLDLLLSVVKSEVAAIEAVGVNVLTPKADIANARLRFASGCIANVTASRISRERVRKARFFQNDSYVSIDYAAQELEVFRLVAEAGARPIIHGGKVDVTNDEPLRRELAGLRRCRPHGPDDLV